MVEPVSPFLAVDCAALRCAARSFPALGSPLAPRAPAEEGGHGLHPLGGGVRPHPLLIPCPHLPPALLLFPATHAQTRAKPYRCKSPLPSPPLRLSAAVFRVGRAVAVLLLLHRNLGMLRPGSQPRPPARHGSYSWRSGGRLP